MNIGQILETHLGWAAKTLGLHVASPVFDGAEEDEIMDLLEKAGLPRSGKTILAMAGQANHLTMRLLLATYDEACPSG